MRMNPVPRCGRPGSQRTLGGRTSRSTVGRGNVLAKLRQMEVMHTILRPLQTFPVMKLLDGEAVEPAGAERQALALFLERRLLSC